MEIILYIILFAQIKCAVSQLMTYSSTKIYNNSTSIFPENLELKVKLTHLEGMVLYGVDKNSNQLIVIMKFDSFNEPIISVNFRRKIYEKSLKHLCNCTENACVNETLFFQFQVLEKMVIQCNGHSIDFEFPNRNIKVNRMIKKDYPIPSFEDNSYASLFFINLPDKILTSISGCIFQIKYNSKSLIVTVYSETRNYSAFEFCTDSLPIETNDGKFSNITTPNDLQSGKTNVYLSISIFVLVLLGIFAGIYKYRNSITFCCVSIISKWRACRLLIESMYCNQNSMQVIKVVLNPKNNVDEGTNLDNDRNSLDLKANVDEGTSLTIDGNSPERASPLLVESNESNQNSMQVNKDVVNQRDDSDEGTSFIIDENTPERASPLLVESNESNQNSMQVNKVVVNFLLQAHQLRKSNSKSTYNVQDNLL